MNIITISREFGSGGRELGKRLADALGYDYYDNEILAAVARNSGLDQQYVETVLANHGWQTFPVTFHGTLATAGAVNNVALLLEQKEVIEKIAKLGKNCVIVGRNADVILEDYHPFNIFVCADLAAKVERCMERKTEDEDLTEKELVRRMKQIDKIRYQTRAIISGSDWGKPVAYHMCVNTTEWDMKELTAAVAQFAKTWFARTEKSVQN